MSKFELQFVEQDHNLVKASFGRVPESEAVCEHTEDDRGAAGAAGRLTKQERWAIELVRSHPVGTDVISQASWRRATEQEGRLERPKRAAIPRYRDLGNFA